MPSITLFAPAKLNLSLRILGKREDGFHALDTIMARTDMLDRLDICIEHTGQGAITLTCSDPSLPTGAENLVVRAATAFVAAVAEAGQHSISIHLHKQIPSGGGLGGGSSDAASTLAGLNSLFNAPLSPSALAELAGGLGSDVPFFLGPPVARCTGRGEIIYPLPTPPTPLHAIIVNPGFGVPTPWAYKAFASAPASLKTGELRGQTPFGPMANDLEPVVFDKYLLLPTMRNWLAALPGASAMMSGSGSTLFALFSHPPAVATIEEEFRVVFGPTPIFLSARVAL